MRVLATRRDNVNVCYILSVLENRRYSKRCVIQNGVLLKRCVIEKVRYSKRCLIQNGVLLKRVLLKRCVIEKVCYSTKGVLP